jgi:hypothetical protein
MLAAGFASSFAQKMEAGFIQALFNLRNGRVVELYIYIF